MFDAKSILDAIVRGGGQQQRPQGDDLGGLSDLLRQLAGADKDPQVATPRGPSFPQGSPDDDPRPTRAPSAQPRAPVPDDDDASGRQAPGAGGGLEDILREVLGGGRGGGGLGDILGKLGKEGGQGGGGLGDILGRLGEKGGQGGGLGDILGQIFGQGGPGATRLGDMGGASQFSREQLSQLAGRSPEELIAKLKELVANNQFASGAALGGLGALILGTGTGRSLAGSAIKLGGLALIGGLAYRAYQNYQQGQPAADPGPQKQALLAAPSGSGFEPAAVSNDDAILLIRAMIAAAAADGRIDASEQKKILGSLQQTGIGGAAQEFLAQEIANPVTVDDLAAAISSQEQAVQVYTAARITVDPDEEEEHEFLVALAERLGIDDDLAAHIDATARGAGT
jgi:uncharacterized membrane protein YebE (DUF533 family)